MISTYSTIQQKKKQLKATASLSALGLYQPKFVVALFRMVILCQCIYLTRKYYLLNVIFAQHYNRLQTYTCCPLPQQ